MEKDSCFGARCSTRGCGKRRINFEAHRYEVLDVAWKLSVKKSSEPVWRSHCRCGNWHGQIPNPSSSICLLPPNGGNWAWSFARAIPEPLPLIQKHPIRYNEKHGKPRYFNCSLGFLWKRLVPAAWHDEQRRTGGERERLLIVRLVLHTLVETLSGVECERGNKRSKKVVNEVPERVMLSFHHSRVVAHQTTCYARGGSWKASFLEWDSWQPSAEGKKRGVSAEERDSSHLHVRDTARHSVSRPLP